MKRQTLFGLMEAPINLPQYFIFSLSKFITTMKKIKKNLIITFVLFLFMGLQPASAQTHTGNIAVTSQAQVDALRTTLAGDTRIDGRVRIGFNTGEASNITDLSPFENITEITGILNIEVNPLLTNLMGLTQLQSIRGSFGVINNAGLTSLGDFPALTMIGNNFEVDNNDNLTSLGDFPALRTISNNFVVENNENLISLGDLSALAMIGNNFVVENNENLISLGNLNALASIGDRFRVSGNAVLTSLGGFPMLTSIGSDIQVTDNALLQGCCVLKPFRSGGATAVSGSVTINNNAEGCRSTGEVNCDAFLRIAQGEVSTAATATESMLDIFSTGRWQLSKPDTGAEWITSIADGSTSGVTSITGANDAFITITTTANTSNRNRSTTLTLSAINTAGDVLTDPPPVSIFFTQRNDKTYGENVTVRNQNEVEALRMLFTAEITRIDGNVTIGPESGMSDITDLSPFAAITEITDDVLIHRNADLQNLTGLNQLQSIGGSFQVGARTGSRGNPSLTSLDFSALESIGSFFSVSQNDALTSLGDFSALESIDGYFFVGGPDFTSLGDFRALTMIGGYFEVNSVPLLTSLGDFSALESIGGYFFVRSTGLTSSLGDFPVLESIGGHFEVRENAALLSLGSLPRLTSIGSADDVFVPSAGAEQDNVSILVEENGRLQGCCVLTTFFRGEANPVSGLVFINNNAPGCSSTMEVNCDALLQVEETIVFAEKTATESTLEIFSTLRWQLNKPNTMAEWITGIAADGGTSNASAITGKDYSTITLTTTANPTDAGRSTTLTLGAMDVDDNPLTDPPPVTIFFTQLGTTHAAEVIVTTQAEVNDLTLPANATAIEGHVTIGSETGMSDITDLSPLAAITEITGNVTVRNNPLLRNLMALNQLQTIGGSFEVENNALLTSLGEFSALQVIGGSFGAENNADLTSLGNFPALLSIKGSFGAENNADLTSLGNFPALQAIEGSFVVKNNALLTSLEGFPGLQAISGHFEVSGNAVLTSLEGFSILTGIGSADGVAVPSTGTDEDGVSILVEGNDLLQDCCLLIAFLSDGTNAVSGQILIGDNATGCDSNTEISTCATQTITFTSTDTGTIGTPITLMATATSTLPVTFAITAQAPTSGAGNVATLANDVLTLVGAGKVTITAAQAGGNSMDVTYAQTTGMQIITVNKQTQTIDFTPAPTGKVGDHIDLTATATSGSEVSFAITEEVLPGGSEATMGAVATLMGTTLTLTGAGLVSVTASQAGNDTHEAALGVRRFIMVSKKEQAIMFTSPAGDITDAKVGQTIPLAAMTNAAGLYVTFSAVTDPMTGVATLTDNGDGMGSLTFEGEGMVTVTATQDGNTTYSSATPVTRIITIVSVNSQSQTITFSNPSGDITRTVGEDLALTATTDAMGLFVTFSIVPPTGVAELTNTGNGMGMLTLNGEGTVTVTATQGGDATYSPALDVTRTITVKQPQTITFSTPAGDVADAKVGQTTDLVATTDAMGLFVTFTAVTNPLTGVAMLTDDGTGDGMGELRLDGVGTVTVIASQGGNDTYVAATPVTRTITVGSVLGIEAATDGFALYPNPTSGKLHFSEQVAEFRLYGIEGRLLETRKNVRSVDLSARPAGLYFVEVVVRGGGSLRWRVVRE